MMITNTERFNALPQRQKKSARTRIALLDALLEELDSQPLAQIRIKDLTRRADVSEPTFFNYFDTKEPRAGVFHPALVYPDDGAGPHL